MPKVSMIVPVFNGMKYIDLFFEPIKRYNPKIEIIFIDNGSEDGSYNYINELTLAHELHSVHSFVDKKAHMLLEILVLCNLMVQFMLSQI